MSVNSISSNGNNQYLSAVMKDLQNLQQLLEPSSSSPPQSSAGQDQITISKDALDKVMAQLQTDMNNLESQDTQGSQGHHHHRHHKAAANNGNSGGDQSSLASLLQSIGAGNETASPGSTTTSTTTT
jgi:hypothetical protein